MSNNLCQNIFVDTATVNISNTLFELGSQSYLSTFNAIVDLHKVTFNQTLTNYDLYGQALSCNCLGLNITNSTFVDLTAAAGAALYLKGTTGSYF